MARDRIRWEAKLEIAKFDIARFESTLQHFMDAADAGNRYMVALADIDATVYAAREKYVFAILDPIGRARVEAHALPNFPGIDEVKESIRRLERLVRIPESNDALLEVWDPKGIGNATTLLSKGRSIYMREVTLVQAPWWQRILPGRSPSASTGQISEPPSGLLLPDASG